jgi:2-polyprenyl-3-methyl-5-hydroxy-6-metoxy-1,4-benzoquinol methylase
MAEGLEEVRCNICNSTSSRLFLAKDGFNYKKCTHCGLVYQSPRPVFRDLRKRYSDEYFDYEFNNQDNFFNLMKLGLKDVRFDSFNHNGNGSRNFLDIGCATGLLLNYVREKGWSTKGVEICKPSVEYARKRFGLDIFLGTLEEAAFPSDSFEVVHFSHVIEHVPYPKKMLIEIRRILKPDGHIIVTTPNIAGGHALFARASWRSLIPDHIYLFSQKTLRKLLELSGYRVVKQVSWGGIPAGKRADWLKKPADRLAKLLNVGDVMLFHCTKQKEGDIDG